MKIDSELFRLRCPVCRLHAHLKVKKSNRYSIRISRLKIVYNLIENSCYT